MNEDYNLSKYGCVKNELDVIYHHITEDIQIRSKCDCYEHCEKSANSFLNLERYNKKPVDDKEITDQKHILEHSKEFYETLLKTGNKNLR